MAYTLPAAGGSGSIKVLPATSPLTGVYAPLSNNPWLTVTSVSKGVVSFSATANTLVGSRLGSISILGAAIWVEQFGNPVVTTMNITAGNKNQTASVGGNPFATNLQVQVLDIYGKPAPGVAVTFASPDVSPSSYTATTDINGLATNTAINALVPGWIYVTATIAGANISQTFTLRGVASGVAAAAGASQSTFTTQPFSTNLKVSVFDANGNPVVGASVVFAVPSGGASGTFTGAGASVTVPTGGDGTATAPTLTANGTVGSYLATATVSSGPVTGVADFSLNNFTWLNPVAGVGESAQSTTLSPTNLKILLLNGSGKIQCRTCQLRSTHQDTERLEPLLVVA